MLLTHLAKTAHFCSLMNWFLTSWTLKITSLFPENICWSSRRLQDMSWRRLEDQQMFSGKRLVILSVHDVRNQFINEQKCAVLARCVSSILYLYKKRAEMQFQSMNISLLHMYQVYLPLYQNCIDSGVLISLNAMWNIRKEVD